MKTMSAVSFGLVCLLATATFAADEKAKPAAPAAAPTTATPPPAAPSPAAVAAGKKIDWAKMDENAKKQYMKKTVLPTMKKLFVAFDKKRYANMGCPTCHGDKAAEKKFKMPNAELPKLPQPTDRAGFMAIQQKKPEAVKFMGTQVKPTMAALLGVPEWAPAKPDGFGCYQCHTKEAAAATPPPAMGKPAAPAPAAPAAPAPAKGW
ncbi:MAG TPA: hypothetical protein VKQ32_23645 [Polyangia bacterium]|nr:hypothetical protein [Polyangia bacterium]